MINTPITQAAPISPVRAAAHPNHARWLAGILLLAALLRLVFILVIDPNPSFAGGDVAWYLDTGRALVTGTLGNPIQPGPTFPVYNGIVQLIFPGNPILALRLLNVLWHAVLIGAVYTLGVRYFTARAARLAAIMLAISPAFVIEAGLPVTESLFMALLCSALALYAWYPTLGRINAPWQWLVVIGVMLGLAALTRAVLLLFPLVIVLHLVRVEGWRRGLRLAGVLFMAYALTLSTWTIYNLARWNRFIIAAEGLTAFAWMGATGVTDPWEVDQQIGVEAAANDQRDQAFISGLFGTIMRDLPGWVGGRMANLGGAYLQPHNTVYFPGESLKDLAGNWLRDDRSLDGLLRLTQGDAFWPKLALYVFHFGALLFGIIGIIASFRRFWVVWPILGYILYTTALHAVLLALPRYLFPMMPLYTLFAAAGVLLLFRRK